MTPVVSILALGFGLGLRHATDPDHVVAVTTIVARERRLWVSSLVGAIWGLGHTLTLLLLGGVLLAFRVTVPPRVGLVLELAVAAMLVLLGAATLARGGGHAHPHVHAGAGDHVHPGSPRTSDAATWRALMVGVVHGVAGTGAVTLVVLSTIDDRAWALAYLVVFGGGTVAGMMLLTTAIALPFSYAAARFERWSGWLARVTGMASVGLGLAVAYQLITADAALTVGVQ
jgi:high-affinity nickel-transport protein